MMEYSAKDYKKEAQDLISNWMIRGFEKPEDMIVLEKLGAYLAQKKYNEHRKRWENGNDRVSTSQIRLAYGELMRIKMKKPFNKTELLMLKPKLAYASARNKNTGPYKELVKVISLGIDSVLSENNPEEQERRFKNFYNLFEAIIAYHKANGGD